MTKPEATFICEPTRLRVNQAVIAALTGGVVGFIAVGSTSGTTRYILAAGVGALTLGGILRAFRLSLRADSERVLIRNYFRSYEFEWADVDQVAIGTKTMGVVPQSAFAFLVMRDGSSRDLRAQATPARNSARQAALRDLQRLAPPKVRFSTG
jgi:hypothetical protein